MGKTTATNFEQLERACKLLLDAIGEDQKRSGLVATPTRFARAWLEEWGAGYDAWKPEEMTCFVEEVTGSELVFQGPINFWSTCMHHIAPFFGSVFIAYLPQTKIIGLSKLPRIVDVFSRRLQIQENLTMDVANAINEVLQPQAVGVVIKARHSCMESRGIRRAGVWTTTSRLTGSLLEETALRAEFFSLVAMSEK